ncbi:MAG: AAA family ATPase [Desulfovibrionaceae bacterium]|nr:AAA family ATPase [Desulfovibrionaceae bacterium]
MYIQEFSIDKYGLFSSQKVTNIPPGLSIVFGKNEAGKSTLLHYLRCMICGIPHSRASSAYKKIPCIDGGFSGSLLVSTNSRILELRRKYQAGGRKTNEFFLYTEDGKALEESLWLTILGIGIDLEIYRNIFGISLGELVELSKEDKHVKDMLYGASIGAGIKSPSSILEEIEEKSKKLYIPRGGKTAIINKALVERERIDAERSECLQVMEEYEELQHRLAFIQEEQQKLDERIKQQKRTVQTAKETLKGHGLWKTISILPDCSIEESSSFCQDIRDELIANDTRYVELESEIEEGKERIKSKENEIASIQCTREVIEHEDLFQAIERGLSKYEHTLEEYTSLTTSLTQMNKEIDHLISELDCSYTREDITSLSIHFALEQEIASIKQELANNTNIAFHQEESIKKIQIRLHELERKLILTSEEEIYYNELAKFENIIHNIAEKQSSLEQIKRDIENIKQNITHTLHTIPSIQWNESNARNNKNIMKFEHTILLKRHIEEYTQEVGVKEQIEEKYKEVDTYIKVKEREQRSIRDTLFEYTHSHTIEELEDLDQISSLLHAQEALENESIRTTHIIRSSLIFVSCLALTFMCFMFSPPIALLQLLIIIAGGTGSFACVYFLYKLDRKIESRSILKQIAHIGSGELTTVYEIESYIEKVKRKIGLTGTTQEERMLHREKILRYIDIEKKAIRIQKEYEREKQDAEALLSKHKAQVERVRLLEKRWEDILTDLYLPLIPLRMESVDTLLYLRKRIDTLLQEEQRLYTLVDEETRALELLFLSLQELSIVQALEKESAFYTRDLMLERCTQQLTLLQEKKEQFTSIQESKSSLEEELALLQKEYENIQTSKVHERWHTWLSTSNFPQFLTPETVESFIQRVSLIKEKINREEEISQQKEASSEKIQEFENVVKKLLSFLPQKLILDVYTLPMIHIARSLLKTFAIEKEKFSSIKALEKEYEEEKSLIVELENRKIKMRHRVEHILQQSKCSSKEDFFRKYALYEEKIQKRKEKESYINSLLQLVYPRSFEEISSLFKECTELDLHETLQSEEKLLEELEQERSTYIEESGKIKEKLEQAEHGDISKFSLEYSMLTAKIEDAMKEWYTLKVTKEIILQAQKQFEEKYQPEVMRIAGDILGTITQGTWNRILRSADNIIKVRNTSGSEKLPEELSRGTQEQMYLALRFAGACIHSMKTKEALPILLDDITVNFDYERTVGVAHAIKNITSGLYNGIPKHQVFLFTCHEHIVETMLDIIPDARLFHMDQGYISMNQ